MKTWVLAEFKSAERLLESARKLREEGYSRLDTYSPFPLEGTSEALGLSKSRVPLLALVGGLGGATLGYLVQWLTNAVDWPINVGGRPPHSTPAFVPITFESGVLMSAFFIFFGLWLILRLPQPYHPVFELEGFRSASTHGFWLSVETDPTESDANEVRARMQSLGAIQVSVVGEQR